MNPRNHLDNGSIHIFSNHPTLVLCLLGSSHFVITMFESGFLLGFLISSYHMVVRNRAVFSLLFGLMKTLKVPKNLV
jgi:hypothetical protein